MVIENNLNLEEDLHKNIKKLENISLVIITHLLPDKPRFIKELAKISNIELIIPKKKSINLEVLNELEKSYNFLFLEREQIKSSLFIFELFENITNKIIILDIGGYFAPIINRLKDRLKDKLLGVIEDTENGHKKYEQIINLNIPIFTVARSPLKLMEDYLVGQSIFFSTESLLREISIIPNYLQVGVLGFGKIGKSIATIARTKCTSVAVFDINPIMRIEALSKGFLIPERKDLLKNTDILFCCTGNKSLKKEDLSYLKHGCFIISATSKDDELDIGDLFNYQSRKISPHITRYFNNSKFLFHLMNDGNAINFLHNAVVGDFIRLVQSEIIECVKYIAKEKKEPGIYELPQQLRVHIAEQFLKENSFLPNEKSGELNDKN
ncbi:adenosylhomocysteinase [Candidatus Pacearchaeota archaeon]|nr:adenosylhomocysteinase [Candidatus Pacearchaeota archaeon]